MTPRPDEPSALIQALQAAAQDLTYPSDSDEPFDAFEWDATSPASAKDQVAAHADRGRRIEEVAVDVFFKQLDSADDADGYRRLRQVLESLFAGLKVFRAGAGEVRVDIYLIGVTRNGGWAGLHTISVET